MDPRCTICGGGGWMCEEHPDKPFQHWLDASACPGLGVPCRCNPSERMPPGFKPHCGIDGKEEPQ